MSLVISTHGTALCTILNYFDQNCGFGYFMKMVDKTPYMVAMEFKGLDFLGHKDFT